VASTDFVGFTLDAYVTNDVSRRVIARRSKSRTVGWTHVFSVLMLTAEHGETTRSTTLITAFAFPQMNLP